jgi:ankyrin repeat protein
MSERVDIFDPFEGQDLHLAAQDGDVEGVKTLIAEGADVNSFDDLAMTPLHWAARGEHIEVMKVLIEAGADVNAHDESRIGNTPLCEVAGNCSLEVARLLVESGADPTIPGWMQTTALDRSSERKRPEGRRVHELLDARARRLKR